MRRQIYPIQYLTRETPHAVLDRSMHRRTIAMRQLHSRAQRGASLIESALAMGLVAIGVFATVSSFGDGTTSRISRGILPVIGGGSPSGSDVPNPNLQSGQPLPKDVEDVIGIVENPGGGTNEGDDPGVAGIVGDPDDGDEWYGGRDSEFVGGIDAQPPTENSGTNSSGSGSWSSEDSNTFIGGIDAYPETGYQGGGTSEGSNTSAGAEVPTDDYQGSSQEAQFPLENSSSAESFID